MGTYVVFYWNGTEEYATGDSARKVAEKLWAWDLDSVTICDPTSPCPPRATLVAVCRPHRWALLPVPVPDIVHVYSNEACDYVATVGPDPNSDDEPNRDCHCGHPDCGAC